MKHKRTCRLSVLLFVIVILMIFGPGKVFPHCDTMDGPVVTTAKVALEKGDLTAVLKWVQKKDEPEIRKAFKNTLAVRRLSPQAQELADMYFFETLVRIHRASEGAAYTGLKPAGSVEPPIAMADKALENGSAGDLVKEITDVIVAGITRRFSQVMETKKHMDDSVEAGREYVREYVEFVHYVEALHKAAAGQSLSHEGAEKSESKGQHIH